MARGRAFDSDASGSGSRGGHGPGRSARGRGGSIPRPSSGTSGASSSAQRPVLPPSHPSSGTSGASSSAQRPVLPPSHPSAPSSSTPVSGPVQTPPAAQSPTVQASSDPRITLSLENYTTARDRLVSSHTDESEAKSRIDEVALYLEAVRGEKKRKVYSIGSQASQFYYGSAAHASTSAGPQPEHTDEHYTELRARVDDQQRQIAELRAHVCGYPQPLPALDPDATDDTLVTPPGTTAHPAGTPPGDLISDRADEQQRRFDFGPF
ncbi:hypothetical protein JCGZ_21035 [Jatropha curcas]|uniref:Uncharacterized protein n=1 Tax=Jatropha curcas TaxID=180498 RepID=A0A067JSS8_JATCU|nr:hypothetical protein JCGZ_21035 [Jatropha curcas]